MHMFMDNAENNCYQCRFGDQGARGCDNYEKRIDLLQKVVDGQASAEEQEEFDKIVQECENCQCRLYCQQQLVIRELLRTRLDRKRVPIDMIEQIRERIRKPV